MAEQTGLIHKLGEWVLEKACLQASQWLAEGWDFGQLAINVASQQLGSNSLVSQVDRLKIDRSFVGGLPDNDKSRVLVQTVIALGSKLGFHVLAEWIETPAQALIQEGCFAGQGYLFAKPLDPEAVRTLRFPLQVTLTEVQKTFNKDVLN